MAKTLLVIAEEGGYPDFSAIYREAGYEVQIATTLRKGVSDIKRLVPAVVVAEFRYKPTYGTQISNLESVFAALQTRAAKIKLIVFYDQHDSAHLKSIEARFPSMIRLPFPIKTEDLKTSLKPAQT